METKHLYSMVFDAIKDPLLLLDSDGGVLLANASALNFFELGEQRNLFSTRPAEARFRFSAEEIVELMKHESVKNYRFKSEDGELCRISMDIETVLGGEGERLKLLHFQDESPEAHREFWKDEMISMVSHEIKNPLSAMKNSVEILLSQIPGKLTEGQKRFLNTSGRSIDRLTHMLDGFLDVSRINSGAFELSREDTDVGEFIASVVTTFSELFNTRRVPIDLEVSPQVGKAFIDAAKVEQVLINILSNALKFTREDGKITLSVGVSGIEAMGDKLRLLPWNDIGRPRLLEIKVQDTGLGMRTETLDHIFDRYHVHSGEAGRKGSHLGLNISRALVEAQGGWIDVNSEIGIGTVVKAHIPLDRATATMLKRVRQINAVVDRHLAARRTLGFYLLGKYGDDDWSDIANSWLEVPVVNPESVDNSNAFHLWPLNSAMAVAVRVDYSEAEAVDRLFGPQFVLYDDGSYVFNTYAIGGSWAPREGASLAQMFHIAANRMMRARDVVAQTTLDKLDTGIECVVSQSEWDNQPQSV